MMAEQTQQELKTTKRKKKRVWLAAIIAVALAIIAYFALMYENVEEQLAAIEAARAIPDSENAATVYNQLLGDYSEGQFTPDFLDPNTDSLIRTNPWSSRDYPELGVWLKEQQATISRLLQATKLDKCRFPIPSDTYAISIWPLATIRQWAFLLLRAANNDLGEGRTDAAIEKYLSITRLGMHVSQHPIIIDHLVGVAVEALGLQGLSHLVIEGDLTETQMKAIEEFPLATRDNWAEVSAEILQVEGLLSRRSYPVLARLKAWWSGMTIASSLERTHDIYLRTIAKRRALKVIIALKRSKNTTGRWPESLDEIRSAVSKQILTDPLNGNSFVYRLAADTFMFYSKGENKIDEDGHRDSTFDPNSGQFIEREDDILFWPRKTPKK